MVPDLCRNLLSRQIPLMKASVMMVIFFLLMAGFKTQGEDLGSWNILHLRHKLNDRFSLFAESQLRSLKTYSHFHYYEYKGGLQFKLNPALTFVLGAGSYQTYAEGGNFITPKNNDEFRLWPQIVLNQSVGPFKIEQRYRAELRWTSRGYRNRFRYRVGLSYPFGFKSNQEKRWQVGINNELFFTDREPYFERNRLQGNLSYKITKNLTLQTGYLHQFDYRINDETGRDFMIMGVFIDL